MKSNRDGQYFYCLDPFMILHKDCLTNAAGKSKYPGIVLKPLPKELMNITVSELMEKYQKGEL